MKPLYINQFKISPRRNDEGHIEYRVINGPTNELITYFYSLSEAKEYCKNTY